jgi:hypothetical protein
LFSIDGSIVAGNLNLHYSRGVSPTPDIFNVYALAGKQTVRPDKWTSYNVVLDGVASDTGRDADALIVGLITAGKNKNRTGKKYHQQTLFHIHKSL